MLFVQKWRQTGCKQPHYAARAQDAHPQSFGLFIDKEIDAMRTLTTAEICSVAGGTGTCTPENSGNDLMGVTDSTGFGDDLIGIYEGAVSAVSHIIERVANSF